MNILIIYDNVQEAIQKVVSLILDSLKNYKLIKVKAETLETFNEQDLERADLIMIGSPTQKWSCTPKMLKFLEYLKHRKFNAKAAVAFSTSESNFFGGSAAKKILKYLKAMKFNIISKNLEIKTKNNQISKSDIENIKSFAKYIWMY